MATFQAVPGGSSNKRKDTAFNSNDVVTIDLPSGSISARTNGTLIHARGIPYATASRFHRPTPVTHWDGTLDCTKPASICPQSPTKLAVAIGPMGEDRLQSEDCLHVNVVAPAGATNAPVMVFIHGGAYVTGGGDLDAYTPWDLATRGVVAVTITYRLGLFGYLLIPDIAPPNLGLMDQIEALRWVQRNVAAFGGDPTNVTIFGQSAGGDSVYCLLVADDADELFQKAILQSSTLPGRLYEKNRTAMTVAMSQIAVQYFNRPSDLSSSPIDDLLKLQNNTLKVAAEYSPTLVSYAPIFGSYPLPTDIEVPDRIASVGRRKRIFLGMTANEGTCFEKIFGQADYAPRVTREDFEVPLNILHDQIEAAIGEISPMYTFAWYPEGNDGLKACHCMELSFLLGLWRDWEAAPMLHGTGAREAVEKLGETVKDLWVAFARGEDLNLGKFTIDENFHFP